MGATRFIAAHDLIDRGEVIPRPIVKVDADSTILSVEQWERLDSMANTEFYGGAICAGMVNAHSHVELSYLRGAIPSGTGFAGFARAIGQVRGNYTTEERRRAAASADALMWEEGVQAVVDIANDDLVMDIKERSQIEYHTMFEFFGINNTNVEELNALAAQYANASVTPHSTYSVSDAPFKAIADGSTAPLSLHFLESDDEEALYHRAGSLWAWYERMGWRCDFLHYGSPAERITESIAPEYRLFLVHATRVTKRDIQAIDSHFTTLPTWVLCPESNRYISRLMPPIDLLRSMGCKIAIGTDSLASARHLSMVDNMRQLGDIPLNELLTYATINGAIALGLEAEIGSIEVGKRPGLVVIQNTDLSRLRLTDESYSHRIL